MFVKKMWYVGDTLNLGSLQLVSILHLRVVVYSSTFRSLGLTSPSTKVEVAYILLKNKVWVDTPKCVLLIASNPKLKVLQLVSVASYIVLPSGCEPNLQKRFKPENFIWNERNLFKLKVSNRV